ncbi:MAG: hypothetical protein IKV03_02465 [Alphaproteobacteria bacterium]|nr:hypothetical protein [Alphaproteobacteria bacterium]
MNTQEKTYNMQGQSDDRALESDISEEAVKERRYLWMARTFALVAVVSFLVNVLLLVATFSLVPLMRVQPFYLSTQDKDQQIIHVVRPRTLDLTSEVLGESFVRQYILARFTVGTNVDSLENTWGIHGVVYWESEQKVFEEFSYKAKEDIKRARNDGFTRGVHILTVVREKIEAEGNEIWKVEVELSEMSREKSEPEYSKWRATLDISFDPTQEGLIWADRLKNPLGFKVRRFGFVRIEE